MKTYNEIYLNARHILKAAGIEAFNLEARLILAKAAGKTTEELFKDLNMYVTSDFEKRALELFERRAAGEPVAFITGEWEFYGVPLMVNRNVLIPRIDTEVLVEKAIELLRLKTGPVRVLDLCCGSGCIGIAIAANCSHCRITMVDNSPEAIRVSKYNVAMNHLSKNINCLEVDALEPPPRLMGRYDLIVSNPPYIPTGDISGLEGSVRDYEPVSALDGGRDGLDFYRSVTRDWKKVLSDKGVMMLECGKGQAESVMALMRQNGFLNVCSIKDTQGIDRVVLGINLEQESDN